MNTYNAPMPLAEPSAWNSELRLPLVTSDAELVYLQIMLGGIHLVLSRLHPKFGSSRFTNTLALATDRKFKRTRPSAAPWKSPQST